MIEPDVRGESFRPAARTTRFFDWASTAPLSAACVRAMTEWRTAVARHPSPPDFQSEDLARLDVLRKRIGSVFAAGADAEVAFVRSVSEASSALARALDLPQGSEILVTAADHPALAASWCWLAGRRPDLRLRTVPCLPSGRIDLERAQRLLSGRTAVVTCTHLTHLDGVLQPVAELAALVRRWSPALLIVDAAQSVGRVPVDFGALGADILVASGRKALLGPMGAGFVIAAPEALAALSPLVFSPRSCEARVGPAGEWLPGVRERTGAAAFEGNLPDLAALHGLHASLLAYRRAGHRELAGGVRSAADAVLTEARHRGFLLVGAAASAGRHGIVRLRSPVATDHREVKHRLAARGFSLAATRDWLRLSVHAFTAPDDIAGLFDHLTPFAAAAPTARSTP
ncbi:aminotransferase class V-fold PLP-dependent enzyme [Streptomyces drozdowiczii]|uniref:aminotransferase class V-fold PLP-dependent enzyme n=1 Tax=Streptomyces drozdowiczii TaxID=202862 RepID=UPI00403CA419